MTLLLLSLPLLTSAAHAQASTVALQADDVVIGAWPGADFGRTVVAAGDVDSNGKPDLLVGAPYAAGDGVNRGRAALFLADRDNSGFVAESWTVAGTVDRGHYGGSLAGGQDLDGDGFDDVVVASSFQAWTVDLYTGGETGLNSEADWTLNGGGGAFGHAVALPGDMDGDGYAELAIGDAGDNEILLYLGSSKGPAADALVLSGDEDHAVGAVLSGAGDVDGDGLIDLLTTGGEENGGAASIFAGSAGGLATTPSYHLDAPIGALGFGVAASGALGPGQGDVNGDGFDDVVIGADGVGDGADGIGGVHVWAGGPTGPAGAATWSWVDSESGTMLGRSVALAGDVDGDGFADVLAGRPGWEDDQRLEGGAVLLMGSPEGPTTAGWTGGSDDTADDHGGVWIGYGQAVSAVGDFDGDTYADVAVGATNTGADSYEGRLGEVRLYAGTPFTPPAAEDTGGDTGGDTGEPVDDGGCGCNGAPAGGVAWLLGLLALTRRRR